MEILILFSKSDNIWYNDLSIPVLDWSEMDFVYMWSCFCFGRIWNWLLNIYRCRDFFKRHKLFMLYLICIYNSIWVLTLFVVQTSTFWQWANACQSSSLTTLTALRRMAHQASFVNGVTASSWWWHSRALAVALWPLGGMDSGQGGPGVFAVPW